jgi:hypothetical protein
VEQRGHKRFPISLEIQYRQLHRGREARRGSGRTINMSSGGILFDTEHPLTPGVTVEIFVNWPFLLEGVCPLKLVMRGRVVRADGMSAAIQTKQHEFRVAGSRTASSEAGRSRSIAK